MRRTLLSALVVALVVGCGGGKEKDKNKDLDRPKPAEQAPAKPV